MTSSTPTARRAPVRAYVLMALTALAASGGIAAVVALTRPDHQLLAFGVTVATTAPVALALGWVLFVSQHTTVPDRFAEDNVENRWFEQAGSRTLLDVFVMVGVGAGALSIAGDRFQPEPWLVLMTVTIVIMIDVALRYTVLRRRAAAGDDA